MTDAERKARFIELNTKLQSGTPLTPAEQTEMKGLLSPAPGMQPGYIAPKTPEQAKAEFEAARAKAAAEETARRRTAAAVTSKGPISPVVPAIKPEEMQANPALLDILKTLEPVVAPPEATPKQPIPAAEATPKQPIPAAPETKIDAGAKALAAETARPGETPIEQEAKAAKLAEAAKDPDFIDKLDKVSKNWGLSLLEALQAGMLGYIGGSTGNWQKSAYQLRMEKEEREKATEEEKAQRALEMKAQDERLQKQLTAAAEQAALDRAATAIAQNKQLSMQEKIAKLQAYQRSRGMTVTPDAAAVELLSGE